MEGFKKMFEKKMEKMSDIREIDLDEGSRQILEKIAKEQKEPDGKRYIFAPNHLKPASAAREQMALADDFPFINKLLKEAGIEKNQPVARGDMDMTVEGVVAGTIYQMHRKAFSKAGEVAVGSIPVSINRNEPTLAQQQNVVPVRKIIETLANREGNITIYPYGNWFESGKQDFSDDVALPAGAFSKQVAMGDDGFDVWRNGIKRGPFAMSRLSGAPVVPVYVEHDAEKGRWTMRVGEPIDAPIDQDESKSPRDLDAAMALQYVQLMQQLKSDFQGAVDEHKQETEPLKEASQQRSLVEGS